jgi:class 3 adenylate cyclase
MASRMESHGSPGMIQVTRATWELIREDFEAEPRGRVPVKGKGEIETWQLVGPRLAKPPAVDRGESWS